MLWNGHWLHVWVASFDALSVAGPADITKNMFKQHELMMKLMLAIATARWKIATT